MALVKTISSLFGLLHIRFCKAIKKERTEKQNTRIRLAVREKTSLIRSMRPYFKYGLNIAVIQKSTSYQAGISHLNEADTEN